MQTPQQLRECKKSFFWTPGNFQHRLSSKCKNLLNTTKKRIKTTLYLRASIWIVNERYFLSLVLNSLSKQINFRLFFYFEKTEYNRPSNNHSLNCIYSYFCKLSNPKVPRVYSLSSLCFFLFLTLLHFLFCCHFLQDRMIIFQKRR